MKNKNAQNCKEGSGEVIQYLTFRLDEEAFATEITKVREVLEHTEVTKVPRTPEFMRGVINLRGNIVPVVDLRLQFGMEPGEVTVDTCIIIIEVDVVPEVDVPVVVEVVVEVQVDVAQPRRSGLALVRRANWHVVIVILFFSHSCFFHLIL